MFPQILFQNKRVRIIFSNLVLSLLLLVTPLIGDRWVYFYILLLSITSYFLTSWSFKQYLYGIKLVNLFVLPVFLVARDRKSTRLNSSHMSISYAVFCLKI